METIDKLKLKKNWGWLTERISCVLAICDKLIEDHEMTIDESDRIKAEQTENDKNRLFLRILITKGHNAYAGFLEVLNRTGQKHVADRLNGTSVSDEEIQREESQGDLVI